MSNQAFRQNLDDKKGPQPGGPYLIQMLFKEPVEMPDKEKMTAVMEKHIGSAECFCYTSGQQSASVMIRKWPALPHRSILQSSRTENARCS